MLDVYRPRFELRASVVVELYNGSYSFLPKTTVAEREQAAVAHLLRNWPFSTIITIVGDTDDSRDKNHIDINTLAVICRNLGYYNCSNSLPDA